jgi:uncharacterized protein
METKWFYTENGQQRGPISGEELKLRADRGLLRPDDMLWKEGLPGWIAANQLQGLFTSSAAPPPPLPPNQPPRSPVGDSWGTGGASPTMSFAADGSDSESRQWAMAMHFSVLLGFVFPIAGLIVPILIWQLKKNELPWLDIHGKHVANWIISKIIYLFVSALLCVVIIGVPLLIALGICAVVFPIIGGIKASNGVAWKYPMAITFFR